MATQTPCEKQADGWSATAYNQDASFVYSNEYTNKILTWLNPQPGERILDLGCGTGELTLELSRLVGSEGYVLGVDSSSNMIEKARHNGVKNCFVGDCQSLDFPNDLLPPGECTHFDAVFSNATLHWCKRDPGGVLRSVKNCLKPGGRFIAEFGGFANLAGLRSNIHNVLKARDYDPTELDPWYFPSAEAYGELLTSSGFDIKRIELEPRLTPLPGRLADWLHLFCRHNILAKMDDDEAKEIIEAVEDACRVDCQTENGKWILMYCRLRFEAITL